MSDWELVEENNQQFPQRQVASEWELMDPEQQKESLGKSALMAFPRIIEDSIKSGMAFAKNIPSYYESAKTEIPGLFNTLSQNPFHAKGQALAGSLEALNKLGQLPANISHYGSERLHLIPEYVTQAIEKYGPQNKEKAISEIFGEPKYPGEALLRGAARNIPEIFGATKAISALKPVISSEKSIAKNILKTHDTLENKASQGFKEVSREVNSRRITKIPIQPEFVGELRDYFPKTRQFNKLIENATHGDYNSLRNIQSDLYTKGKSALKSPLMAEKNKGAEMLEKRDIINQSISDHLKNTGNFDLEEILNNARKDYKTLQDVYYNPRMNRSIIKMVDKETRKIPTNLLKILNEESIPMRNFLDFHPNLPSSMKGAQIRKNISSSLGKHALPAGAGALGAYGAMRYFDRGKE